MSCRVFGLEPETVYGEDVQPEDFNLDFDHEVDSMDFKLNDEPVTKSVGSRMNKKARAGVIKPTGSIETSANLQILGHYFYGYLDNYKFTAGAGGKNIHEFWGGENKRLNSFRGRAVYDELIFNLFGLLVDSMKLEVSSEDMTLGVDFVYKTELSDILYDEDYERAQALINDLFIMFYDINVKLDNKDPEGVQTSFTFEGSNNHDVDKTIGFGARHPQNQAKSNKRENSLSLVTTLTKETMRAILDARYGDVNVNGPTKCKILQVPFEINAELCEYPGLGLTIIFPKCTLLAEFDVSGVDDIETTLNLATLGSSRVLLADENTHVTTDMYVKLVNNMHKIGGGDAFYDMGTLANHNDALWSNPDLDEKVTRGAEFSTLVRGEGNTSIRTTTKCNVSSTDGGIELDVLQVNGDLSSDIIYVRNYSGNTSVASCNLEELGGALNTWVTVAISFDGDEITFMNKNTGDQVTKTSSIPEQVGYGLLLAEIRQVEEIHFKNVKMFYGSYTPSRGVNPETRGNLRTSIPIEPELVEETVDVRVCVTDDEDDPISGVSVEIEGSTGNTGSAGGCTLQGVPVGVVIVTATKEGYEPYSETVTITSETETLEITLEPQK